MSELERRRGTIQNIYEANVDELSWVERIHKLQELGYVFEEITEELEYAHCPGLIFAKNKWWKLTEDVVNPYDGFSIVQPLGFGDEVFGFDCQWYNGGACFEEVLEGGFEDV